MTTSFLNIPPETPEHFRTDFLNAYADIEGTPLCTKKIRNGVEYCTGTRVYQVTRQYQHIPRLSQNMFGRTIVCIYDKQPEEKENQERKKKRKKFQKRKNRQYYSTDDSGNNNYDSDEETDQGWKQPRKSIFRKQEHTQHRKQNNNTYNNVSHIKNRHNNNS